MGSLSLKKKISTSLTTKTGGIYYIIFKGPAGTTFGSFFNPGIAAVVNSGGAYNFYFNGDLNNPSTYYTDGGDWYDGSFNIATNNIIPIDAILQIESDFLDYVIDFGGNIQNYFGGKTSIKKQILTKLKTINGFNDAVYRFKSATNNTLAQIFNPSIFALFDQIDIYIEGSLSGPSDTFNSYAVFTTSEWISFIDELNYDNYVIPNGSILVFSCDNPNLDIPIGGGAVIEKYYSGKLNLGKQNYKILKDGEVYIFLGGSNNTISTFLNDSETIFGASGIGTEILVYNSQNNVYDVYLRRTSTSWRDANNVTVNNLVIQPNSRIIIQRSLTGNTTVQGTNIIQKYY
jgi:hypothetical protein